METGKKLRRLRSVLLWTVMLAGIVFLIKTRLLAPPQVEVTGLAPRDLTAQVYGNGTVEAKVMVGVSSRITGRIVELCADQGDRVVRGQLLARLEDDDFAQQERQARAGLSKAQAALGVEAATLQKALANLGLAEKNLQRFKALAAKELVSRLEVEQYESVYAVAREEVSRSRAALDAARMEIAVGQAGVGLAASRLADTRIHAPQDGIIISRDLEQGSTVVPGLSVFTLADPETVWVKANVDEALLKGISVGSPAVIFRRSTAGEPLPGRVARLGRQSDRITEELEVDVVFIVPSAGFRLGEQSDVLIEIETRTAVPSLPSLALVVREGKRGVWCVEQGRLRFREVAVGIEDRRGFTEILTGLRVDEAVALAPPLEMARFKEAMPVRTR